MSTHVVEIISVGPIRAHPNADRMQITDVLGWSCCIGKGQFQEGERAVYIEPDYLVPLDRPEFAFLKRANEGKEYERIRVRRFRGVLSQGLLIPVPEALAALPVGSNVIDLLGIKRYEPPEEMSTAGQFVAGPSSLYAPKFDVETYQRHAHLVQPGEEVVVTEKIHGANARYTYAQDANGVWTQFCGSRTNWMAEDDRSIWWKAFKRDASISAWCVANPGKILFGEVFGGVQSLKYGATKGEVFVAAFAVLDRQRWLNYDEFVESTPNVTRAPLLYRGPFDHDRIAAIAEQDSVIPGAQHMSEGVVIIPIVERWHESIGRVVLKLVSNRYLES